MIENKIFEILDYSEGYEKLDNPSKLKILEHIEKEWENLPQEKYTCSENALIAILMIDEYINFKNTTLARKWAKILSNNDRGDYGEEEFILGKILFEEGDLEKAKDQFMIAMKKSEGRAFEGEPKKYIDLLKKK